MLRKLLANTFLVIAFAAIASVSKAQLYEIKIDEKIANSSLIIEGKVISQHSFWNEAHTMIYTTNRIELYKTFKGVSPSSFIEIVTIGGSVGDRAIHASDLLELDNENVGVFFCFPNSIGLKSPLTGNKLWDVYSSSQGFFSYDLYNETAAAPFVRYQKISTDLYNELNLKIGQAFKNNKPSFDVAKQQAVIPSSRVLAPSITSFSPATVNAGALNDPANNLLTITGSGFGASFTGSAAIFFDDANNGSGGTALNFLASSVYANSLVVSWSDTEIKVRVPARAGTGFFTVRDASGLVSANSPTPLKVAYSILTSDFSSLSMSKQLNLMNNNNLGGYTILYSTNTNNSGLDITTTSALATFKRALSTWKEIAGFNVIEGGNTTVQTIGDDGVNVIMYDNLTNGSPAPSNPYITASGTLAVCYSYSGICLNTAFSARKMGFDIVIRNNGVSSGGNANFTAGPCSPNASNNNQTDLESVLFHEIGHAINLAHVNGSAESGTTGQVNPAMLMNWAISNGTRRTSPDNSAKAGALFACTAHGYSYGTCYALNTEMTQLTVSSDAKDDCPGIFPSVPTAKNTSVAFDMVHTSSNVSVDPAYTQIRCDAGSTPVTNNAYYAIKTNYTGVLSISINSYVTTPTDLASCSEIYAGVPVTGFRLALYQVSNCPTGQSYPAPVACRTFAANGALTDITGLLANTNYLIFIESIENTKATFNMVLGGSALPIKLSSFTGEIIGNYNNLNWVAESIINVKKIIVERSSNGVSFESIGEIIGSAAYNKNGNFKDLKPFIGNSYYRLQIVNSNGIVEYSNIVLLKRSDRFLFSINPNPAVGFAEVQVSSEVKGNYTIVLHNTTGQKIMSKTINVNNNIINTRLDVSKLAKGIYSVTVFDESQTKIKTMLLSVQ